MSTRHEPLRGALVGDASEQEIRDVWQGIQRLRARAPRLTQSSRSIFPRATALGLAALAAFCIWFLSPNAPSSAGPLRDSSGQLPSRLSGERASSTLLSDGSRIQLDPDSELEVLDNDASTFSCVLRKGRGTFEVKPGGSRRWRIETSLVLVEVVGTRFVVERQEGETRVNVERGSVIVRGERVPDGVQKLAAGQRLVVTPAAHAGPALTAAAELNGVVATKAASSTQPEASPVSASRPNTNLLQSADEQRRRGDVKGAIQTLRAAVAGGAEPPRRAIAAFTLGKLLLDAAGRPAEAEGVFRTCLRLSPPSAVAEDALARLVEAQVRSGKTDAARSTARQYEQRYPSGRRLADVQRWANSR